MHRFLRFLFLLSLALLVVVTSAFGNGGKTTKAQGGIPPFPAQPVSLQIIDVGGQKQLTGAMIDNYAKANPDKISSVEYITDTAPNLPGRIKAQIDGGKIDTAL